MFCLFKIQSNDNAQAQTDKLKIQENKMNQIENKRGRTSVTFNLDKVIKWFQRNLFCQHVNYALHVHTAKQLKKAHNSLWLSVDNFTL